MLLYYITDRNHFPGDEAARRRALLDKIAEAAACGVDLIQLREKDLASRDLEKLAQDAVRIVHENSSQNRQTPKTQLLINSRVDIAIACGADGVHLRSDDISAPDVRTVWERAAFVATKQPLVAVSCHTMADVVRAASNRADFAVFAPVFGKKDLPANIPAGLPALHDVCGHGVPVLALGGVNLENARSCLEAGAAGVAGIRLFQQGQIAEIVRLLRG
ncbi:MAG TPA: thiamine phosphate synthase [Terriglobales bacterium]|nr:thiamine phosphate synthase [Terriglobales bacterium]